MLEDFDSLSEIFNFLTLHEIFLCKFISKYFNETIKKIFPSFLELNDKIKTFDLLMKIELKSVISPCVVGSRLVSHYLNETHGMYDYVSEEPINNKIDIFNSGGELFIENDMIFHHELIFSDDYSVNILFHGTIYVLNRNDAYIDIFQKNRYNVFFCCQVMAKQIIIDEDKKTMICITTNNKLFEYDTINCCEIDLNEEFIFNTNRRNKYHHNYYIVSKTTDGMTVLRLCYFDKVWKIYVVKTRELSINSGMTLTYSVNLGIICVANKFIYSIKFDKILWHTYHERIFDLLDFNQYVYVRKHLPFTQYEYSKCLKS